jgi:PST family polysaccharide transporter
MISFLVGYSETAIYSAGIKITESLYFLPITIAAIFFPNLIKENRLFGIEGDTLRRLVFYLFWSSLICSAFISFFIEPIWRFLFEDKYQHSILITIIHSWTLPFVSLGLISSRIYVIEGLQHLLIYRSLFIVLLNIILNIPAIIFYGALGAVVTTLVSQVFAGLFFDFFNKETRGIFYMKINSLGYLVR